MSAQWRDDTREKLDESLRREQGDDVAELLAAYVSGAGQEPVEKRGRRKRRVGHKPLPTHGIPQMKPVGTAEDARERTKYAYRLSGATGELRSAVTRYGADSPQAKAAAEKVARAARNERIDYGCAS